MEQYRTLFLDESRKHLDAVEAALIGGRDLGRPELDELFREVHSLKGMAASMGYTSLTELAHRLEDLLDRWRARGEPPGSAELDLCLRARDRLAAMREDVAAGGKGELDWSDLADTLAEAPVSQGAAGGGLAVAIDVDRDCESPAARAYLILLRYRELDPQVESTPTEAEILKGAPAPRLVLRFHGATPADVQAVYATLTEVGGLTFLGSPRAEAPAPAPAESTGREGEPPPEPGPGERAEGEVRVRLPDTVQAPVRLLDEFVDLVGELTIVRSHLEDTARGLGSEILRDEVDRLGSLIRTFHGRVMGLRMLPFSLVTAGLRRVVRETARRVGREVELRISGEEIGMDKSILLQLSDPLAHLVRNAIDHGLEPEDERRRRAKQPAGCLDIRAARAKNQIEVTVADDGRGIDAEAVRRRAVEAGLYEEEESRRLSPRELFGCLFRPGFSTRTEVSETSGRGVGLDVVKTRTDALGGSLELSSTAGGGTEVRLTLPLSVAIVPVLTVSVGAGTVAFPVASVARTLEALPRDVRQKDGTHVLLTEQGQVPIVSLAKLLRLEGRHRFERMPLVLVHGPAGLTALAVDRFLREEDLFIKPLKGPLRRLPGLSGYSVLGDGSLVFLLDPATMLAG